MVNRIYRSIKKVFRFNQIPENVVTAAVNNIEKEVENTDELHKASQKYWKKANDTFLAPPEYYEKQEIILNEEIKSFLSDQANLLDVGCGNGRFTFLFAKACKSVVGVDISELLIKAAEKEALIQHINNVVFFCADSCKEELSDQYDAVSCMGVTSTIIDESIFSELVSKLKAWVKPGGLLILKESVGKNGDEIYQDENTGYTSIYRDYSRYKEIFSIHGFEFIKETELAEFNGKVNKLFILKNQLLKEDIK